MWMFAKKGNRRWGWRRFVCATGTRSTTTVASGTKELEEDDSISVEEDDSSMG